MREIKSAVLLIVSSVCFLQVVLIGYGNISHLLQHLGVQTIGTTDFLIAQERVRRDAFSVIN